MTDSHQLRATFNQAAHDYAAVRPGYPEQLFVDIIALSALPPGAQALEIGCGTGQATLPFAQRGYRIHCLDIGPDLLAVAAENLRAYPQVHFENTAFEDWPIPAGQFDLVYSATAFHWVPRESGYPRAAQALKPGGALAVFNNFHPHPYAGFFVDVQPIYNRYLPALLERAGRPSLEGEIAEQAEYIRSTGLFSSVEVRTYPWSETYTTADYLRLLNTYSNHIAIPAERRRDLYQAIAALIDTRYAGKVDRPYLTVLYIAKKASTPRAFTKA